MSRPVRPGSRRRDERPIACLDHPPSGAGPWRNGRTSASCDPRTRSPNCWATASAPSCRGRSTRWPRRCRSASSSAPVDFALENRRARPATIYDEAVEAVTATKVALKYPTDDGRGEPQRDPPAAAGPLGHPSAGLHDPRGPHQLPPRARPGHRPDRDRRDLRRPRPDDRRGRRRQPADRRAAAGAARPPATPSTWPARRASGSPARRSTRSRRRPTASSSGSPREVAGQFPEVAAQRRALRRAARQGHHGPREVPDRAGAQRVRRLPLGHGVRPGRLAGHRRQRQPRVRRRRRSSASPCSTPPTARPPTSPARTWPTRPRSSWPSRCCSTSSARSAVGQAVKNATLDLLRQGVRTARPGRRRSRPRPSPRPSPRRWPGASATNPRGRCLPRPRLPIVSS